MAKKTKKVLLNARTGRFASKKYDKAHPEKAVRVTCKSSRKRKKK